MKNSLITITENIPSLIQNTSLNVTLQGWPAAVSIIIGCMSGVAIVAIKTFAPRPNAYTSMVMEPSKAA